MKIIGIDPGVAITGFAVLEESGSNYQYISSGCIRTAKNLPTGERLRAIYEAVNEVVKDHQPNVLAIEKLFFSKNVRTAFQVGEARGVIILAATNANLEIFEYTPLQVKQAVAGYGKAEKGQVQKMVQMLLKLSQLPRVDDEADAMAVALCHLQYRRFQEAVKGGNP